MKKKGLEPKELKKKDFTKKGIKKLINRTLEEINHLSDNDLISIWSFFKFLITDIPDNADAVIFVTPTNSLIYQNKEILEKKYGIKIMAQERMMAM